MKKHVLMAAFAFVTICFATSAHAQSGPDIVISSPAPQVWYPTSGFYHIAWKPDQPLPANFSPIFSGNVYPRNAWYAILGSSDPLQTPYWLCGVGGGGYDGNGNPLPNTCGFPWSLADGGQTGEYYVKMIIFCENEQGTATSPSQTYSIRCSH